MSNVMGKNISINKKDILSLVFCADQKYIKLLPTVLKSISSCNDMSKLSVHLLHNITDTNILSRYKNHILKHYKIELNEYFIAKRFEFESDLSHLTDATMFRLLIPEIVNVNHTIIYLDLDLIVQVDLMKLLDVDTGQKGISGKSSLKSNVLGDMTQGKIKSDFKTLNAGVLVMDLDKLKTNSFTEYTLQAFKKFPYIDQVLINLYLQGQYNDLPREYNIFNGQDEELLKIHNDYILHYVGFAKPWFHKVSNFEIWKTFETFID